MVICKGGYVLTFIAVGFNDMLSWRNDFLVPPDGSPCNDTGMQKSKCQEHFIARHLIGLLTAW